MNSSAEPGFADVTGTAAEAGGETGRRRLRLGPAETYPVRAADDVEIRLTRYRGGSLGPVLLVHCIGVSSRMYSLDTIETNLAEYLFENGFDVWLLDMRLSIELPALGRAASFDDVANLDYPAAVAVVLRVSGASSLQVVAHGIGSQTFSMAMLAGLQGVRSAVCSQVAIHPYPAGLNRIKAYLRAPELLERLNVASLDVSPDDVPALIDRLFAIGAWLHPIGPSELCASSVCRRITALYGPLYVHARLNEATHASLGELFGRINVRTFRHLITNLRAGHVVREDGVDAYLPHLERMAIPICFIHGGDNACLRPEGTEKSIEVLSARNGGGPYRYHVIPTYGHVDCIIGEHAVRDVYPRIRAHLVETAA